jgi:hypothetical protein
MTKPFKDFDPNAVRNRARALAAPAACLVVLCGALALSTRETKSLAANGTTPNGDLDADGIVNQQELLLGTDPNASDSDFDGFTDLEELARGSDPLLMASTPAANSLSTSCFAYSTQGILIFQAVVFVQGGDTNGLSLQAGMVNRFGQDFSFGPDVLNTATFFSRPSANTNDLLMVMSLSIPELYIGRVGQLNLFTKLEDTTGQGRQAVSAVMSLAEYNGTIFEIQAAPFAVREGDGVIYRPLNNPNEPAPLSAAPGKVCWQDIVPVASSGNLLEFEVQNSDCEDFDAFCETAGCQASFGGNVQLIDAGSLLGG